MVKMVKNVFNSGGEMVKQYRLGSGGNENQAEYDEEVLNCMCAMTRTRYS